MCSEENVEQLFLLEVLVDKVVITADQPPAEESQAGDDVVVPKPDVRIRIKFLEFPCFEIGAEGGFSSGKSCLFPMPPRELIRGLQRHPLAVTVFRAQPDTDTELAEILGQTRVRLNEGMCESVYAAMNSNCEDDLPLSCKLSNNYILHNSNGAIGSLDLFIRLSCFGKSIVTQFNLRGEKKSFLFKNSHDKKTKCPPKVCQSPNNDVLSSNPFISGEESVYDTCPCEEDDIPLTVAWKRPPPSGRKCRPSPGFSCPQETPCPLLGSQPEASYQQTTCPTQTPCPARAVCPPPCPAHYTCPAQESCPPACPAHYTCPIQAPCPARPSYPILTPCPAQDSCPPPCPAHYTCPIQAPCPARPPYPIQAPCPAQDSCPPPCPPPCPAHYTCPIQAPCPARPPYPIQAPCPARDSCPPPCPPPCPVHYTFPIQAPCPARPSYPIQAPCPAQGPKAAQWRNEMKSTLQNPQSLQGSCPPHLHCFSCSEVVPQVPNLPEFVSRGTSYEYCHPYPCTICPKPDCHLPGSDTIDQNGNPGVSQGNGTSCPPGSPRNSCTICERTSHDAETHSARRVSAEPCWKVLCASPRTWKESAPPCTCTPLPESCFPPPSAKPYIEPCPYKTPPPCDADEQPPPCEAGDQSCPKTSPPPASVSPRDGEGERTNVLHEVVKERETDKDGGDDDGDDDDDDDEGEEQKDEPRRRPRRKAPIYSYKWGLQYPGTKWGHLQCVTSPCNVPPHKGFLWRPPCIREDDQPHKPSWRPGAISRAVSKIMAQHRADAANSPLNRRRFKSGTKGHRDGHAGVQPPTLHIHRKDGAYYISLHPLDIGADASHQVPLEFKIPRRPADDDDEDDDSSSQSDMEIEFMAPGAFEPKPVPPVMRSTFTQVEEPAPIKLNGKKRPSKLSATKGHSALSGNKGTPAKELPAKTGTNAPTKGAPRKVSGAVKAPPVPVTGVARAKK